MQLTQFTDFSLRVLLYLAVSPDQFHSVGAIADSYDISRHHLLKVARGLAEEGFVETRRGKQGGLRLALPPDQINIGKVVRRMEPGFPLVACFPGGAGGCCIAPMCNLTGALNQALGSFLKVLDGYTLADCVGDKRAALIKALRVAGDQP